jgi:antirestriction protein
MEVSRGGKDPDLFFHVVSEETADALDGNDPLADLDEADMLASYLDTEQEAREWCRDNGHVAEAETFEAVAC